MDKQIIVLKRLSLVVVSALVLYYLWTRGVIYFRYSRVVYTDYFWYRAPWLLAHVVCGVTAIVLGALQFIPFMRIKMPMLHRTLGKIYLGCVAISTGVSGYLVSTSGLGLTYGVGLGMLGVAWLGSGCMAYLFIRKGNVEMHRNWMIKSYVLTLSFVWFRWAEDLLARMNIGSFIERKVLMAWACWAIPLFITIVIPDIRKLLRRSS